MTENNKKIAFVMIAIMAVAGIMGIMKTALADKAVYSKKNMKIKQSDEVKTDTAATEEASGMDRDIISTEN